MRRMRARKLHILQKGASYLPSAQRESLCGRPGPGVTWERGGEMTERPRDSAICGACFRERLKPE